MGFSTFTLELSVTTRCNLGCSYCYVANRDVFMTPEIFDKKFPEVLDLMERAGAKYLNVSFFGGEPLLNWELITHVTKKLRTEYKDIVRGLVLISNLTLIDEEKVKFLKEWGVGVSWSFDGITSNESRPLLPVFENKNKDGELYENIMEMYADKIHLIRELTQGCKVMIWPGNVSQMVENYKFFIEMGMPNPDFSLVRDDVWTKEDLILFHSEIKKLADENIKNIKNGIWTIVGFFRLHILDAVVNHIHGKRSFACFAGHHGAVLTPNGDFYPCARFASKDFMKIDDEFSFEYWSDKLDPRKFDKCKECDLYQVCNTGCTYSQIRNDNKPLDSVCELFHMIEEQSQRIVRELKDNDLFARIVEQMFRSMG